VTVAALGVWTAYALKHRPVLVLSPGDWSCACGEMYIKTTMRGIWNPFRDRQPEILADNFLSKLITLFIAPIFIFDAISGDRGDERLGLILSKPITRAQYLLMRLLSASFAFGIVFLPILALGFPAFKNIVPTLTLESYFGTSLLVYLLGFFSMSVGILVSTLTRRSVISFIAMFGLMAFFMLPNAMKYTSDTLSSIAMATPHYYATYFTSRPFDALLCVGFAALIILFSLPFILVTVWKFKKGNL